MNCNLFTVASLISVELAEGLARTYGVGSHEVDVSDSDGDQEGRNWDSPVLCTYELPVEVTCA